MGTWSNMTYELTGTPCSTLIQADVCHFEDRVAELFPTDEILSDFGIRAYFGTRFRNRFGKPIGLFSALSRSPIKRTKALDSIFYTFTKRVGLELELLDKNNVRVFQSIFNPTPKEIEALIEANQIEDLASRLSGETHPDRPQVLCVDDEVDILELLMEDLEASGFSVTATNQSSLALEYFIQSPKRFSAIVSDIKMPAPDGMTLLREFRRISPKVPVIFISGHAAFEDFPNELLNDCTFISKIDFPNVPRILKQLLDAPSTSINF